MFNASTAALFDTSGSLVLIAALNLHENAVWSAGITAACGMGLLASMWVVRTLKKMHLKRGRWIYATAELIDMSINVKPVNSLRQLFGKTCKVARICYCYTYEVNGLVFQGTAFTVDDIDIAYDAKVHSKRTVVASQLPIQFLESSPKISALKQAASPRKKFPSKRPVISLQLLIGCMGVLMLLFSGWRVASWKYMQHKPVNSMAEIVAASASHVVKPSDIRYAKKMRSLVSSKKTTSSP